MRNGHACAHQTWEHPTDESESSLLPTPLASPPGGTPQRHLERKQMGKMQRKNPTVTDLGFVVKLLPTPRARGDAGPKDHGNGGFLEVEVTKLLPTPNARDWKGSPSAAWGEQLSLPRSIGGLMSQPSDDGNASRDQHQDQPTNEEGLILDLWSG